MKKKKATDDVGYWDKKVTILKYHEKLYEDEEYRKRVLLDKKTTSNENLFDQAQKAVGTHSYNEEIEKLGIKDFFCNLNDLEIAISINIGYVGALTAIITDVIGKPIENILFKKYDVKHPADYKKGHFHRYHFGHDIINPFEELPKGFQMDGKDIGGRSLFKMVGERYCPNSSPIQKLFCVTCHNLVHYLRDFITPDGLPLPGSSMFTQWEENLINKCGFSSSNTLMDTLGRELGSLKASDFTSVFLMKFLSSRYIARCISGQGLSKSAIEIFKRQVNIITTSSCLTIQLFLLLFHFSGSPSVNKSINGARLNLLLFILFTKNAMQLSALISKEHNDIIDEYDKQIDLLSVEMSDIDDWREML